jgi:hypothetical protein
MGTFFRDLLGGYGPRARKVFHDHLLLSHLLSGRLEASIEASGVMVLSQNWSTSLFKLRVETNRFHKFHVKIMYTERVKHRCSFHGMDHRITPELY